MSTDDEVERLLQRTRAARERVNSRMAALGKSNFEFSMLRVEPEIFLKVKRGNLSEVH